MPIIVVNDGSTDQTAWLLEQWEISAVDRRVITYAQNLGKAAALQAGFREALQAGFTHGITIDTDGQLWPEDIPALLQRTIQADSAIVLGVRDSAASDYPTRSRFGRWFSNLLIWLETGKSIADSQCGLRVYPLKFVTAIRCRSGHYGFETEIITRAVWAGVPIVELPVRCKYFNPGQRVSHFKPGLDSLRAIWMHARLIATAINPIHHRHQPSGAFPARSLPSRFLRWLNPIATGRQVRHDPPAEAAP